MIYHLTGYSRTGNLLFDGYREEGDMHPQIALEMLRAARQDLEERVGDPRRRVPARRLRIRRRQP